MRVTKAAFCAPNLTQQQAEQVKVVLAKELPDIEWHVIGGDVIVLETSDDVRAVGELEKR